MIKGAKTLHSKHSAKHVLALFFSFRQLLLRHTAISVRKKKEEEVNGDVELK